MPRICKAFFHCAIWLIVIFALIRYYSHARAFVRAVRTLTEWKNLGGKMERLFELLSISIALAFFPN